MIINFYFCTVILLFVLYILASGSDDIQSFRSVELLNDQDSGQIFKLLKHHQIDTSKATLAFIQLTTSSLFNKDLIKDSIDPNQEVFEEIQFAYQSDIEFINNFRSQLLIDDMPESLIKGNNLQSIVLLIDKVDPDYSCLIPPPVLPRPSIFHVDLSHSIEEILVR